MSTIGDVHYSTEAWLVVTGTWIKPDCQTGCCLQSDGICQHCPPELLFEWHLDVLGELQ